MNPQKWEEFPQQTDGEYLMLWPGQFCQPIQKEQGVTVPSSMRQVDMEGEIEITSSRSRHPDTDSDSHSPHTQHGHVRYT